MPTDAVEQAKQAAQSAADAATAADRAETNAAKFAEEAKTHADKITQYDPKALIAEAHHYIQRNTAYNVGDVLTSTNLPFGTIIVVTQSGIYGADEPDWDTIKNNIGGVNDDGTLKFKTESMFRQAILAAHPVGSIYESTDPTSPAVLFGGTWEAMEAGRVLVSAGTASTGTVYKAGDKGGEEKHKLTESESFPHSHTRGSMNITGSVGSAYGETKTNQSGAFTWDNTGGVQDGGDNGDGEVILTSLVKFDASRSWSGSTSVVGGGQPHNNMMPYEVIHRWKRTA